jgi:hypothetical protein
LTTWNYAYPDGSTEMRMVFPQEDNDLLDCERIEDNLTKEGWLLNAIRSALDLIGIKYDPLYCFHSFKIGQHRADFGLYEKGKIEAKNWNCVYYSIGYNKVDEQILPRFHDSSDPNCNLYPKICVISRPQWDPRVRDYTLKKDVILIELGYFVTFDNYSQAVDDLCKYFKSIGLNQDDFVEKYWQEHDIFPYINEGCTIDVSSLLNIIEVETNNELHQSKKSEESQINYHNNDNDIVLLLVLLHRAIEMIFIYYTSSLNQDCPGPPFSVSYTQRMQPKNAIFQFENNKKLDTIMEVKD